ncbi:MAG: chromosomal replication initiator protein DnaA [Bacteroidaceae bacterium]
MDNQAQLQWDSCLKIIKANLSESSYHTWFSAIRFHDFNSGTLTVRTPSPMIHEFIEVHFRKELRSAIQQVYGSNVKLVFKVVVDDANGFTTDLPMERRSDKVEDLSIIRGNKTPDLLQAQEGKVPQNLNSNLNPNYTFENFMEGACNKLTRSIGQSFADNPTQVTFNPFFIFGASGVGKTHLANAIGTRVKELYPQKRVLYVSAHLFQVQYTDSVRNNKTNDFINFYQTIDILIIDDIQEIAGKSKTLQAFFHIFNHLHQNGRQLIMTCDRPPAQLEGMEERLLTRFKWGMIAELDKPDNKLRKNILLDKMKENGVSMPNNVINYIAANVTDSIRDLEGVITSLQAYSIVYNSEIDLSLAERVVSRSVNMEKKPLTVEGILDKVCEHFHVTTKDIFSTCRKRDIVNVRQISMYLTQKHTKMPYAQIGLLIGKRDHSTVMHSCRMVEKRISIDNDFRQKLEEIESGLNKA